MRRRLLPPISVSRTMRGSDQHEAPILVENPNPTGSQRGVESGDAGRSPTGLAAIAGCRHEIESLLWENGCNRELATERLDVLAQGREINVFLAFDARYVHLSRSEDFGQFLLSQVASFAGLSKSKRGEDGALPLTDSASVLRVSGNLSSQNIEALGIRM